MSALIIVGYIGLCVGFCAGVLVMALFKAAPIDVGGYQPEPHNGPVNQPPRRP